MRNDWQYVLFVTQWSFVVCNVGKDSVSCTDGFTYIYLIQRYAVVLYCNS